MTSRRVLVYTRTTGYRHDSIPDGVDCLAALCDDLGLTADPTEDPAAFSTESLAAYAAVVFLSTSGEVLDDAGRAALTDFVEAGGGFLGVHAASTTEYDWPWYGRLVGARFAGHPEFQRAVVTVEDRDHPATAHLEATWPWADEWYDFGSAPREVPGLRVLATVDERGYRGGSMGADHPLVWCQEVGAGRSFYTALGHAAEAYADPAFRTHLRGALGWAIRAV
jgi:type 1 glutamine amidotransferase